jgi:hypothetical protein
MECDAEETDLLPKWISEQIYGGVARVENQAASATGSRLKLLNAKKMRMLKPENLEIVKQRDNYGQTRKSFYGRPTSKDSQPALRNRNDHCGNR